MATQAVAASTLGDNTVVAAVAGKKIRVNGWELSAAGATNAKWRSGANDKTGLFYFAAAGASADSDRCFECNVGEALVLNLSAAVAVGGYVDYSLE